MKQLVYQDETVTPGLTTSNLHIGDDLINNKQHNILPYQCSQSLSLRKKEKEAHIENC